MREAEAVTFAGGVGNRAGELRGDVGRQATLLADPRARCLGLWRGKPLLDFAHAPRLGWRPTTDAVFAAAPEPAVFLGARADGAPRFARAIPDWEAPAAGAPPAPFLDEAREAHPALPPTLRFADLRASMATLAPAEAAEAATAKGLLGWHATHRFCARCGGPTEMADAGWKRACPACGAQHFPRTDPVVIMLVVAGNDVLLGRAPVWPEGMFSLLAGFMEPGESIEAAVRRETCEETSVRVGAVEYLASQPWPFPSSLMIGCRGAALTREIVRDPVELEDARWVDRETLVAALAGEIPDLRPARPGSIARFLLERWLADRLG